MMAVVVTMHYLITLTQYASLTTHDPIKIYYDNMEEVNYETGTWMGTTPRWVDKRHVCQKRPLKIMLSERRHIFKIEHTKGH